MIKILILSDYSRDPERRILKGLVQYANERGGWAFFQAPPELNSTPEGALEICKLATLHKADAIYGKWPGIIEEEALKLGIPVVLRTHNRFFKEFDCVSGEYGRIGVTAADFFISKGLKSFAFFGVKDIIWSAGRLAGFRERLDEHSGQSGVRLNFSALEIAGKEREREKIQRWLRLLPKPCGLFACNDLHAQFIAQTCHSAGIRVPEEISILGADNDDFLCNVTFPTLSSININYESVGFQIGRHLEKEISGRESGPFTLMLEPEGIIERDSTKKTLITDPYIRLVIERMTERFQEDIGIKEIIEGIPLSRRSIEMRFRAALAPATMLSFLTELRLQKFCELLKTTDLPISEAATASGFSNFENVFRSFNRRFSCSPLQYRRKFRI